MKTILRKRVWRFIAVMAVLTLIHHFLIRLDWGAPERIRTFAFSGDAFVQGKGHTRAVLIEATPQEIWPWILQMGQDRQQIVDRLMRLQNECNVTIDANAHDLSWC